MKKQFLIVAALLFAAASLSAQSGAVIDGNKVGLTASSALFAGDNFLPVYTAYTVGGVYHLSPAFALKPGIVFKSTTDSTQNKFLGSDAYDDNKELLLGLLLEGHYYRLLSPGLYLYAGPGAGYTVSNRTRYDADGKTEEQNHTYVEVDACLGLQYFFSPALSCFVDTGLSFMMDLYKDTSYDSTTGNVTGETEQIDRDIYVRSPRLGVTLYFN